MKKMYLDPGFGGMLVQVIVLIVAVGGGIIFSLRKKIKALFSKNKPNSTIINNESSKWNSDSDDAIDVLGDISDNHSDDKN
jgi:hypothetical protein